MAAITAEEAKMLLEFREHLKDSSLKDYQTKDYFLVRWLRARAYDMDKATAMLSEHLKWSAENDLDYLLNKYEPPAILSELIPFQVIGQDQNNSPIVFFHYGKVNMSKVVEMGLVEDAKKYFYKNYLSIEAKMRDRVTPEGIPVTQFVYLIDCGGASLRQYANLQVMDFYFTLTKYFEANHPESVKLVALAHAGRAFSIIFSLMKPLMHANTMSKLQIVGDRELKEKMPKLIPPPILPPYMGGTNTAFFVQDKPSDVMVEEEEELEFASVPVPAASNLVVSQTVAEGNSIIEWAFKTFKYDIGFGVTRDGKAYIENGRRDSHVNVQEGTIACDVPGEYEFTFDNTYSRMRSKMLQYRIEVKPGK